MRYVLFALSIAAGYLLCERGQEAVGIVCYGIAGVIAARILYTDMKRLNTKRLKPLAKEVIRGLRPGKRLTTPEVAALLARVRGSGWLGGLEEALLELSQEEPNVRHFTCGYPPKDRSEWMRVRVPGTG